jgi:hypothetical protein
MHELKSLRENSLLERYGLQPVPSEEIGWVPQVSILRPGILLVKSGSGPIM